VDPRLAAEAGTITMSTADARFGQGNCICYILKGFVVPGAAKDLAVVHPAYRATGNSSVPS
jgi:hypothetical protein